MTSDDLDRIDTLANATFDLVSAAALKARARRVKLGPGAAGTAEILRADRDRGGAR